MTVVVAHSTAADGTFSATGAAAWDANHTLTGVGTMAEQNANNVAITGGTINGATVGATTAAAITGTTITASTAYKGTNYDANTSAGGDLRTNGGTACLQWGAGGGTNVTINAAINMNGANAHIEMSPTGTGHVTINPTAVGDMDNMVIGATTPKAITGTTITATTFSGAGTSLTGTASGLTAGNVTTNANLTGAVTSVGNATTMNSALDSLTDVVIATPVVDQILKYNGSDWVNGSPNSISGGSGIEYFNCSPTITATSASNALPILSLATSPVTSAEQTTSTATINGTVAASAWLSGALGRTTIDAGIWNYTVYASVNTISGVNTTVSRQMYAALPFVTGTVTTTGTGTSRTATASAGTPFATTEIVASATNTLASYLQTPQGLYQITARTSDTVVTISTLTTYVNEAAVAGTVWKLLFAGGQSANLTTAILQYNITAVQPAFTVSLLTKLGAITFATSTGVRTVTTTYNGTLRNTHIASPLAVLHNQLGGLQGGAADEQYHSTLAEYTGSGTGNFVRATSPTLVTPALGTPSALVGTNITGTATAFTASNVTTNANLTGPITSVGNATSIASQTGTGTKFVVDTSPTLVTPTATTTIGVGAATPSASGAGITFPATQSASTDANTLDDYEEGTWTIGISFGGASVGITSSASAGTYTRIGNVVTVRGYYIMTNKGSSTGTARITGLPFTAAAPASTYSGVTFGFFGNISFSGQLTSYVNVGATTCDLVNTTLLGVNSAVTNTNFANNSTFIMELTYAV